MRIRGRSTASNYSDTRADINPTTSATYILHLLTPVPHGTQFHPRPFLSTAAKDHVPAPSRRRFWLNRGRGASLHIAGMEGLINGPHIIQAPGRLKPYSLSGRPFRALPLSAGLPARHETFEVVSVQDSLALPQMQLAIEGASLELFRVQVERQVERLLAAFGTAVGRVHAWPAPVSSSTCYAQSEDPRSLSALMVGCMENKNSSWGLWLQRTSRGICVHISTLRCCTGILLLLQNACAVSSLQSTSTSYRCPAPSRGPTTTVLN